MGPEPDRREHEMSTKSIFPMKPSFTRLGRGHAYAYLAYDCSRRQQGGFEAVAGRKADGLGENGAGLTGKAREDFIRGFVDYCETH